MPQEIPSTEGYDIYAINIPAREVGGDYYDFIKISAKTAIALGDVSGKGLPASMLMANIQATLRGQLLFCNCAKDCVKRANSMLFRSTDTSKFVTLFFGILDAEQHTLTYCNAGHNEPIFIQNDAKNKLDKGGMLLSIFEHIDYDEEEILFDKGSILVVFTDGITEAMNEHQEEYGDERLPIRFAADGANEIHPPLVVQIQGGRPAHVFPPDLAEAKPLFPMKPWKTR